MLEHSLLKYLIKNKGDQKSPLIALTKFQELNYSDYACFKDM